MTARPTLAWLVPMVALLSLWPLSDATTNRTLFLALNGLADHLPAAFWSDLTVLGDTLVALCLMLLFLRRRPDLALAGLIAALPATLISHGLKNGLAVMRPVAVLGDQVHVIGPYLRAGAFPSGHTTTAFVLAAVLTLGLRARGAAPALLALAGLVALSRIAVGAHWPLDIAGGVLCGWLSGVIGLHLARRHAAALTRPGVIAVVRLVLLACALALLVRHESAYPLARPFEQTFALAVLVFHLLPGWRLAPANEERR